ncbi:hypothetical protein Pelo_12434 [Pelomyxa schiedti]|nr:hypothetical protein Pelo_12434 [Pelomyxa schiedti]
MAQSGAPTPTTWAEIQQAIDTLRQQNDRLSEAQQTNYKLILQTHENLKRALEMLQLLQRVVCETKTKDVEPSTNVQVTQSSVTPPCSTAVTNAPERAHSTSSISSTHTTSGSSSFSPSCAKLPQQHFSPAPRSPMFNFSPRGIQNSSLPSPISPQQQFHARLSKPVNTLISPPPAKKLALGSTSLPRPLFAYTNRENAFCSPSLHSRVLLASQNGDFYSDELQKLLFSIRSQKEFLELKVDSTEILLPLATQWLSDCNSPEKIKFATVFLHEVAAKYPSVFQKPETAHLTLAARDHIGALLHDRNSLWAEGSIPLTTEELSELANFLDQCCLSLQP